MLAVVLLRSAIEVLDAQGREQRVDVDEIGVRRKHVRRSSRLSRKDVLQLLPCGGAGAAERSPHRTLRSTCETSAPFDANQHTRSLTRSKPRRYSPAAGAVTLNRNVADSPGLTARGTCTRRKSRSSSCPGR